MQPPMIGSWTVRVQAVRPFSIHGDLYYELQAVRTNDAQGNVLALKIPQHAAGFEPRPGETYMIKFLMGQATEVRPASTAPQT
jgi:hypothetical protein